MIYGLFNFIWQIWLDSTVLLHGYYKQRYLTRVYSITIFFVLSNNNNFFSWFKFYIIGITVTITFWEGIRASKENQVFIFNWTFYIADYLLIKHLTNNICLHLTFMHFVNASKLHRNMKLKRFKNRMVSAHGTTNVRLEKFLIYSNSKSKKKFSFSFYPAIRTALTNSLI